MKMEPQTLPTPRTWCLFFIIDKEWRGKIEPGKLGDLAPTILTMMKLPIPEQMTGKVLIYGDQSDRGYLLIISEEIKKNAAEGLEIKKFLFFI